MPVPGWLYRGLALRRTGFIEGWLYAGLALCRAGFMQGWLYTRLVLCRAGFMQDWFYAGLAVAFLASPPGSHPPACAALLVFTSAASVLPCNCAFSFLITLRFASPLASWIRRTTIWLGKVLLNEHRSSWSRCVREGWAPTPAEGVAERST